MPRYSAVFPRQVIFDADVTYAGAPKIRRCCGWDPVRRVGLPGRNILNAVEAMAREYIEQRDGSYFIAGTRVSLDSVVYAFLKGESPEVIAESFPALGLEEIFGALAFYIANREIVDRYLQ